jgi:hypothetical protein
MDAQALHRFTDLTRRICAAWRMDECLRGGLAIDLAFDESFITVTRRNS